MEGSPARGPVQTILAILLLGGLGLVLYLVWPEVQLIGNEVHEFLRNGTQEDVEAWWAAQFGRWGIVAIVGLMLLQSLLTLIPALLVTVIAVLAYGPVLGGLLAWSSLVLATSMTYALGRVFGPAAVTWFTGRETQHKIDRFVGRYGAWAVVAACLSPTISTDIVCFAAGLMRMGYLRFFAATSLGTIPLIVLVAYLGADITRLQDGLLWISIASVLLFAAYVMYDWVGWDISHDSK